ncbi:MAG: hypothetical protein IJ132_06220, partial [Firmicutes bacterium]|nr:hypothetical protein [Bacillota bacterium]
MEKTAKRSLHLILLFTAFLLAAALFTCNQANAVDKDKAKDLKLDTKVTETVTATLDEDTGNYIYSQTFKVITTNNTNLYEIVLANSSVNGYLEAKIYDSDLVNTHPIYVSADIHEKESDSVSLGKNKTYYLEVSISSENSFGSGNYALTMSAIKDDAPDSSEEAKIVKMNKKVKGTLSADADVDWYKFYAPKDGNYYIKVYHMDEIYDEDVTRHTATLYHSRKNSYYKIPMKKGEHIYLNALGTDYDSYWFIIRNADIAKPLKVALKSVKAGKKSLTVKFKAAKYAKKYQVAVKKKGAKKWKFYNSKKLTYKVKKLAKGKKYQVKVRGVNV